MVEFYLRMQIANQARDIGGSNLEAHLQNKHRRLEHGTRNIQIFGLTFLQLSISNAYSGSTTAKKVAEKIEIQTCYSAELYNLDVRQDQRHMAEKDLFPFIDKEESRPVWSNLISWILIAARIF